MLTALAPANSHRTAVPDRSKRLKKKKTQSQNNFIIFSQLMTKIYPLASIVTRNKPRT